MTERMRPALTFITDYYDMMSDPVRVDAYASAIEAQVRPGDVVVDLGAGLGILSLLAARAGARMVYAIEMGDAARLARRIVETNGLSDRIVVLEEHSLDVELTELADVLVSETLGSFALDENTLPFTIDARDRLMKKGGRMIPCALDLWFAPVEVPAPHREVAFWREVCGFDFSDAIEEMLHRMSYADVQPGMFVAEPQRCAQIDLTTVEVNSLAVRHEFTMTRPGSVHGLAGWFGADLGDGVRIETAPGGVITHWRQAFFPYRDPVKVIVGDVMDVKLRLGPKSERDDDTVLQYEFSCTQLATER